MGFTPSICRMLILLHKKIGLRGPVLTLGNQDVWADYQDLKESFVSLDCSYHDATILPTTSELLRHSAETESFVHAKTFFEMLGIRDYADIDKFESDSPAILHDLNTPIPAELTNKFNLVIDGGTLEHIFDVRQVMENIVHFCRLDGWIVHLTPTSNYIDHGFYSFSPCFFFDFYAANGFGNFICYILQINPENLCDLSPFFPYSYGMDMRGLLDPARQILVFFAARKVSERNQLVVPAQGIYDSAARQFECETLWNDPAQSAAENGDSITERIIPGSLLPLIKPLRPFLGAIRRTLKGRKDFILPYTQLRRI
jgi:hypothetical protein